MAGAVLLVAMGGCHWPPLVLGAGPLPLPSWPAVPSPPPATLPEPEVVDLAPVASGPGISSDVAATLASHTNSLRRRVWSQ